MALHEPPGRRVTRRGLPARFLPRALFAGRARASGPDAVGTFLSDRDLHQMFETIGGTYDAQNHLLSLGRDIRWRRVLVGRLRCREGESLCDMGTGTGDVAIAAARRYPGVRVAGIDFSERMLGRALAKAAVLPEEVRRRISLRPGDIRGSGFPDGFADVLTSAFALRNIPDRAPVLRDFHRVLRPGGRLFILETCIPTARLVREIYALYVARVMPFLGNLLSRTDYAYSYLRHSIEGFPPPSAFLEELAAAGFERCRAVPLTFGIAVLFSAFRGGIRGGGG
jgi:demethylmenaquinone methyltransferase/2-methoxy-6-polyprenyl-1,4-benzoquinol methylase